MIDVLEKMRLTLTILFVLTGATSAYLAWFRPPVYASARRWLLAAMAVAGIGMLGLMIVPLLD